MKLFGFDVSVKRHEDYYGDLNEGVSKGLDGDDVDSAVDDINSFSAVRENVTSVSDSTNSHMYDGSIVEINESVSNFSLKDIRNFLDSDNIKMGNLLEALKQDFSYQETYNENEEMAKDTIIGSAMELMTDDCNVIHPTTKRIISISSQDKGLEKFLMDFLDYNIDIDSKIWEWTFEVIKHGDFKLRRREYKGVGGAKGVYYEPVTEGYSVFRIEYMGQILGYLDEEEENSSRLVRPDNFVHFMSSKMPKRKKLKVKVRPDGGGVSSEEEITCYKVGGTCLLDNARYIYRVVNLLDDMLVMSRVARSTQFNIVKIEVGNAGPKATQSIISDVRRRIEGSTRMNKNKGMRTDPSPIPVNSNVYIPVREGKGDITIDSINDSVDVRAITDIDYFRNKEFAAIRTPKAFLGFDEMIGSGMGNTNLTKLDIRYSRTVSRAQSIVIRGIEDLCNNYLEYRGRGNDVGKFEVVVKSVTSSEDNSLVEDIAMRAGIVDSINAWYEVYPDLLDKQKTLWYLLSLIGINPSDVGSDELIKYIENYNKGKKVEDVSGDSDDDGTAEDEGFDENKDDGEEVANDPNVDNLGRFGKMLGVNKGGKKDTQNKQTSNESSRGGGING